MTVTDKFKDVVRKAVRRAKTAPYVGRAVQIASAIWRIPETRRRLFELAEKVNEHNYLLTEHTNKLFAINEKRPDLDNLTRSVPAALRSLNNRVEFVRRELMFEMRYGARSKQLGSASTDVQPRIISAEKVATARKNALRLNLGCGHVALGEYINIDRRELSGVDVIADVASLPFEKSEVDEIFSAHVLEHFPQEQLKRELLPYWKSLLKPGGIFRAVVPDAEFMIKEYCQSNYPYAHLREVTFGSQDYDGDFHFNMFSREQLSELLTEAGFSNVQFEAKGRQNGICFEMAVMAKNGTL
jgi:predicted SAM-dependent methyltransferase